MVKPRAASGSSVRPEPEAPVAAGAALGGEAAHAELPAEVHAVSSGATPTVGTLTLPPSGGGSALTPPSQTVSSVCIRPLGSAFRASHHASQEASRCEDLDRRAGETTQRSASHWSTSSSIGQSRGLPLGQGLLRVLSDLRRSLGRLVGIGGGLHPATACKPAAHPQADPRLGAAATRAPPVRPRPPARRGLARQP
jgi:hypothetical protein